MKRVRTCRSGGGHCGVESQREGITPPSNQAGQLQSPASFSSLPVGETQPGRAQQDPEAPSESRATS